MELFWLLVLSPFILMPGRGVPPEYYPWLVAALAVGPLLGALTTGTLWPRTPADWCVVGLLLWLPVTFWASVDKHRTWSSMALLLLGVAWYLAWVRRERSHARPMELVAFLVLLAVGIMIIGPLLAENLPSWAGWMKRIQILAQPWIGRLGESINPNVLAGGLILLVPLLLSLAINSNKRSGRSLVLLGLVILSILELGLTASRGAYIALLVSLGVVLCLRWPWLLFGVPLLSAMVGYGIHQIGWQSIVNRIAEVSAASAPEGISGLESRLEIWSRALYALQDFAFTGIGFGTFDQVIPLLYPYFTIPPDATISHAHNLFLQVGVDMGIPGLVTWLALQITVLWMLVTALCRLPRSSDHWAVAAGALGGLVAMYVHGLVDAVSWASRMAVLPWLLYALTVSVFDRAWTEGRHHREIREATSE